MIYKEFQGISLSALGFGTMRLPMIDGKIDQNQVNEMTDIAIENGINYFDTAWPYHMGESEIAIGEALSRHDRSKFYLATKFPAHQIMDEYNCEKIFNYQLKKCKVDYLDFYLLHNVCENSIDRYMDPNLGILEYFKKKKEEGKIKHLGMSCHGRVECLKKFLDYAKGSIEFCQIQLNYVDVSLQDAAKKVELLNEYKVPVWVMEPLRGGKLAKLPEVLSDKLKELRSNASDPEWGFRFLQSLPVTMILSGMSNIDQMKDNIRIFNTDEPTSEEENTVLYQIAEELKKAVPCTGCRYCVSECKQALDIPLLIKLYNDIKFDNSFTIPLQIEMLENKPGDCLRCGACMKACPQGIDIPYIMKDFVELLKKAPDWEKISKERNKAIKELEEKGEM